MTENEKLYPYLVQASRDGFITYTNSTPEHEYQIIQRGIRLDFLRKRTGQLGIADLTEKGQKVVDANGDFSVVDERPTSVNVTATNAIVGDISGTIHQSSVSEPTKSEANTPNTKPSNTNRIALWMLIIAIITIIVMIWLDYN